MESKGVDVDDVGVCVGLIQQKAKLSQSTVSLYLAMLENAGLIQSTRIGQWTYYKRNDKTIRELTTYLTRNL
jgi:ArsR family transcriptional regulator